MDELGRLQWIAYHLSAGEFAEAEELGWDGSREDPCATSKASAALAARTAVIAKEEEGRLEWIAHHLAQRDFSGARELGWEGSEADPAAAASAAAAAAARAARAAAEKVAAADIATREGGGRCGGHASGRGRWAGGRGRCPAHGCALATEGRGGWGQARGCGSGGGGGGRGRGGGRGGGCGR